MGRWEGGKAGRWEGGKVGRREGGKPGRREVKRGTEKETPKYQKINKQKETENSPKSEPRKKTIFRSCITANSIVSSMVGFVISSGKVHIFIENAPNMTH